MPNYDNFDVMCPADLCRCSGVWMKRRDLLIGLAAAPALLAGCGGSGSANSGGVSPIAVEEPEASAPLQIPSRARHFKALEGEVFYIEHPFYGSVDAVLTPLTENAVDPKLEQFALGFKLPAGSALPEGTYQVTHHSGSVFALYLQQSQDATDGYDRYVALFSHLYD